MSLDDFRLIAQTSAGIDGVAYLAEIRASRVEVELRVLEAAAASAERWKTLSKRLKILPRIAHECIRPISVLQLDGHPPLCAFPVETRPLLAENRRAFGDPVELSKLGRELARALQASHRLSLPFGRLDPWMIWSDGAADTAVDISGIDIGTATSTASTSTLEAFRAPELRDGAEPSPESDVYALGTLLGWLADHRFLDDPGTIDDFGDSRLRDLIRGMTESDPVWRLTLDDILESMASAVPEFISNNGNQDVTDRSRAEPTGVWTSNTPLTMEAPDSIAGGIVWEPAKSIAPAPASPAAQVRSIGGTPERLGRYRLLDKLGQGGMGEVYRGEDESDGTLVAIKVLRPEWAKRSNSLERFQKEARLLGKVKNPYVTKLLDVNAENGFHYIVLELVEGESLDKILSEHGAFDEPTALTIIADVARGLADAHGLGIVHRDIKPANIILVDRIDPKVTGAPQFKTPRLESTPPSSTLPKTKSKSRWRIGSRSTAEAGSGAKSGSEAPSRSRSGSDFDLGSPRVKLSDFGLARYVEKTESIELTQTGMIVGTPSYMAPEQCTGGAVDVRTDVYALGATLFHLVAGHPPFDGDDSRALINKHINEPAPSLGKLRSGVSEGLERVVAKSLSKVPSARYADASAMLQDLEKLLRGEPTSLPSHPVLPTDDPRRVLKFDFEWELESSPRQLWPHVSNTDRLDRALGFGAVRYTLKFDPTRGVRRFLEGRKAGQIEQGEEHPYEWIEGRRLGVFREYTKGPFHWVISIVELVPKAGGGTTLTHRLRFEPRGRLVRFGSKWGVGHGLRRDLGQVYGRIDAAMAGKLGKDPLVDPFEAPPLLDEAQKARLDELLGVLSSRGLDPTAIERLGDFLAESPDPELARIRPITLARKLGIAEDVMIDVCLHAADAGLLVLLWDLICPACRLPSQVLDSLRSLSNEGHCEACQVDYLLDFAGSVELIFQAHPQIRVADTKTYCAAGPAHSPHVVAQVRVAIDEHFELDLDLTPGSYRLRGPQLGWIFDFEISSYAATRLWALDLSVGPEEGTKPVLKAGGQVITLLNHTDHELLVRIERSTSKDDALTAAKASTLAGFRMLFPLEILAPGRLVSVANVTLVMTAIDQPRTLYERAADPSVFSTLHEQFRVIEEVVKLEGGAVVKTVGEGIVAAFDDPKAAIRAAFSIPSVLEHGETTKGLSKRLKGSIHKGPAMAATLNDHLDYFGATVHKGIWALEQAPPGSFILTKEIAGDPMVAAILKANQVNIPILAGHDHADPYYGPILAIEIETMQPIVRHDTTLSKSLPRRDWG